MFPRAVPTDLSLLATGTKTADSELEITSEIEQIFQEAEDLQGPWSDMEQDSSPDSSPRAAHVAQHYTTPQVQIDQSEIVVIHSDTDEQTAPAKQPDTAHATTEITPTSSGSFSRLLKYKLS